MEMEMEMDEMKVLRLARFEAKDKLNNDMIKR